MHRHVLTYCLLAATWLVFASDSRAEFYRYRNADGVICFTDDLSKVPKEKADNADIYYDQFDPPPTQEQSGLKEEEMTKEEWENKDKPKPVVKAATTAFTFADNKILVRVRIGSKYRATTATLLLDTGATTTVIHESLARRIGLQIEAWGQASIAGGQTIDTGITTADFIALGPKRLDNPSLTIIAYYGAHAQHEGLLGMDFLKNFPHTIDTKNMRIVWSK